MAEEKVAEDKTVEDDRTKIEFWRRWISDAKKAAKSHHQNARMGWNEYEGKRDGTSSSFVRPLEDLRDSYPLYWSSVKILESAFYSRTPKLVAKRRWGIRDQVAMTASIIVERLGDYQVEVTNFDDVMMSVVGDYIHADKATNQLRYTADLIPEELPVIQAPDGNFYDMASQMPVTEEVFQRADGSFFYQGANMIADPDSQELTLLPCSFDEVLHTPDAKCEEEIMDKAYSFFLSKDDAIKRFNLDPSMVQWKRVKDEDREREESEHMRAADIQSSEWYLEGYECWCKKNKKVYWYSDQVTELLDMKDDPYELVGFFPSPNFILGSKPRNSMFPTPVFLQLYPQIRELHKIAEKIPVLIDAIRRRAIVDGDEELIQALNSLEETEFISSRGLNSILEKGGIENMVWYVPVQELVQSISELNALTEKFKTEFNEFFGIPDIMRGEADPLDAQETIRRRANAGNDRFRYMKKQVKRLARDSIQMMVDLALKVYSDEKIMQIVGFEFMSEHDKARFPQALAMARDDKAMIIRLDIETDSMSFVDEHMEAQKMQMVNAMVSEGIRSVSDIIQVDPALAIVPLNVMLMSLENVAPGRAVMDDIRQQIGDMIEEAKEKKKNPPPPPPDYEKMKLEIEQQKVQNDAMKEQMKMQLEGAKLMRVDFKNQLALQKQYATERMDMVGAQQEQVRIQLEAQDRAIKTEIEGISLNQEQQKVNLEEVVQNFMMQVEGMRVALEQQGIEIERFKAEGEMMERMQEEARLAQQVKQEGIVGMIEAMKPEAPKEEAPPPQIVNMPIINPEASK
jgi:hypothetical protein